GPSGFCSPRPLPWAQNSPCPSRATELMRVLEMPPLVLSTVVALLATAPAVGQTRSLDHYIENPAMVAENQEAPHVVLIPQEHVAAARTGEEKSGPFYQSIDG